MLDARYMLITQQVNIQRLSKNIESLEKAIGKKKEQAPIDEKKLASEVAGQIIIPAPSVGEKPSMKDFMSLGEPLLLKWKEPKKIKKGDP